MTENFPVFVEGQTLTHTELNELRDFLDAKDHSLGQLVGFGIGCGLEVRLEGSTYIVDPGMAIDQLGRPIVVTKPMKVEVGQQPELFDWLNGDRGVGQTVVLTLEEVIEDAPDCEEDGCSRHAAPARRTPVLRVAVGCLEPSSFTVATSELGGINPLVVSKRSVPSSTGAAMRTRLLQIMRTHGFSAAAITKLSGINLTGTELPGAASYKAGLLNQVYFAMIEFLRCAALTASSCFHETKTPGVALGCAVGGKWDCTFGHHWEPTAGLARSLLGSGCEDPCRFHRTRIEALILGFVPLNVPEPADPPKPGPGGPYRICRHRKYLKGVAAAIQDLRDCYHVAIPGDVRPDVTFYDPDPDIAFEAELDAYPIDEIYGRNKDPIGAGVIDYVTSLGHAADVARQELIDVVDESEGSDFAFEVMVVNEGDVLGMVGYEPAGHAAITDQIVLVASGTGMVIATGRVPVNHTLNGVGPAVRDVSAQASVAVEAAKGAATGVAGLRDDVVTIGKTTQDLSVAVLGGAGELGLAQRFETLEGKTAAFGTAVGKTELDLQLAALTANFNQQLTARTSELEVLIVSSGKTLRTDFTSMGTTIRSEVAAGQTEVRGEFTRSQTEVRGELAKAQSDLRAEMGTSEDGLRGELGKAQTELRAEMGTSEDGLRSEMTTTDGALRGDLSKAQMELRTEIGQGQSQIRDEVLKQIVTTGGRIDDVLIGRKIGSTDPRLVVRPNRTNPHIVETFRAMADMMTVRVGDGGSSGARDALVKVERSVTRMEAAAEVGGDIPTVAGTEILDAFESLAVAATEVGVSANAMRAVKSSLTKLRRELES